MSRSPWEASAIGDLCGRCLDAFGVPVVYVNSFGRLEPTPGIMGWMMKSVGFRTNGKMKIFAHDGEEILHDQEGRY